MFEASACAVCYCIGRLWLQVLGPFPPALARAAAFPVGLLAWTLWLVCMLAVGLQVAAVSSVVGLAVFAVTPAIPLVKRRAGAAFLLHLAWESATIGALAYAIARVNATQLSYDSFEQLNLAYHIVLDGHLSHDVGNLLASWGVFFAAVHVPAVLAGGEYLAAPQSLLALSLLGGLAAMCHRSAPGLGWLGWVAPVALLLSTEFFFFQAFYLHNNMYTATFTFFAVASLWRANVEGNRCWLGLGALGVVGSCLCRTEAPVLMLAFLVPWNAESDHSHHERITFMVPPVAFVILWYLRLLPAIGGGSYIMTPGRVAAVVGLLTAFVLLLVVSRGRLRGCATAAPPAMVWALACALPTLAAIRREQMADAFHAMLSNLARTGHWEYTWWVVAGALCLTAGSSVPKSLLFSVGSAAFGVLVLVLGFLHPYRVGWFDSANRISTHVLPCLLLFVLARIAAVRREDQSRPTAPEQLLLPLRPSLADRH